jgi:hypothetical protein
VAWGDLRFMGNVWNQRKNGLIAAIRSKAARTEVRVKIRLEVHRNRQSEHTEQRPRKAEGIFTVYPAIGFRKRFSAWEKVSEQLMGGRRRLERRVKILER